jgi:hypothetical protein
MHVVFIKYYKNEWRKIAAAPSPKNPQNNLIMKYIMVIIDFVAELFSNNFRNVIHNLIMCPKIIDKIMNYITKKKNFITFGL